MADYVSRFKPPLERITWPSQGEHFPGFTVHDLEAPNYLIGPQGLINQIKNNPGQFGFTINFPDEKQYPKHIPQTYSQLLGMLLVTTRNPPPKAKIIFWSREELPAAARFRIVIVSKDGNERRNPIKVCNVHQQWNSDMGLMEHYIIPADSNIVKCTYQHSHPVLVVPVEYFQKQHGRHLVTEEDGYNYIGEFYFPCNTSHLRKRSVLLVASLEVLMEERSYTQYRSMGIATVEVRVCSNAGRDKSFMENKLSSTTTTVKKGVALHDKGTENSDSNICLSDGEHPPTHKKKKMATSTSEAPGSRSNPGMHIMGVRSEAKTKVFPEDETRLWKLINGVFSQLKEACPIFGILVIGETGTGKSSLINNLLGREVAPVGHTLDSETLTVTPHELSVERVPVVVYDTPGLDDTRRDKDEEKHLEIMKSLLARGKIHLVIHCLKMTETRMRRGLIHTFEAYHKIGVPWEQTVITITFADKEEDTTSRFSQMQQQVKKTLLDRVGVMPSIVERLKICPTAKDPNKALPTGRQWYVPFWLDVVEVLVPAALAQFLRIHKNNIHMESMPASSQPKLVNVTLAREDQNRFRREVNRLSVLQTANIITALNHRLDTKWLHFGTFLRVEYQIMEAIQRDKGGNPEDCMLDLLGKWTSNQAGTGTLTRTWQTVVEAVQHCGDGVLAESMARKHGVNLPH